MERIRKKIKVAIIDDSALVRALLKKGLGEDPALEVVGTAHDVYAGRDLIVKAKPDVITLDIEMPRMDGLEFLRRLMPQYPVPVIVVSSLSQRGKYITIQAMELGAVDYVPKPSVDLSRGLGEMMYELRTKIKIASTTNVGHWKNKRPKIESTGTRPASKKALTESTDKVIAIGASTGGTEAIREVIQELPPLMPGIVVVQHMPKVFTKTFADRLNEICLMQVKEAEDGDRIMMGRVLIAPGDFHMRVERSGGQYLVKLDSGDKVSGHRPSVDVLFQSVAETVAANAFGVILTGMGSDGAKGLKAMRDAGARTIGQNKETCVVYGMPRVAHENGAVELQLPVSEIGQALKKTFRK